MWQGGVVPVAAMVPVRIAGAYTPGTKEVPLLLYIRGTILNTTYGTYKDLPGIYFALHVFLVNCLFGPI